MYGHDSNAIRSRYDYYYSVSSPSLSQAANYFENQASLFGESVPPLLPIPLQRSPSPSRIQTPLTPFNTHNASTPSSATTNYVSAMGGHPPLIENFDNHLYESIRRNIIDRQNNNDDVSNSLNKHHLWTQNSISSDSPTNEFNEGFDARRKRARTAFGHYKSDDDVSQNKYRTLSAGREVKDFQISFETTASDTDNNNGPTRTFFNNNKPHNVIPNDTTSNSSSSKSKLTHSISHSKLPKVKKKPAVGVQKSPYLTVKSKSDLNTLKTYPDSFTIVASPKRSPSAGYNSKRRKNIMDKANMKANLKTNVIQKDNVKLKEDDDDSIMDFDWVKPPPEKLYEASRKYLDEPAYVPASFGEPVPPEPPAYVMDHFGKEIPEAPIYVIDNYGKQVSMPTSPIITDKVKIGSRNRVPDGSFNSHKKIAFAIINDKKNKNARLLRHRDLEDPEVTGRFSPYSRYAMQRELSMPALNRLESFDSDDGQGFFYFIDEDGDVDDGRKTSIGFVHNKQMSASLSNLSDRRRRPQSEMRKGDPKYMSTPNFIKINRRAVIQSTPMEKINPRLVLHRSLKGVLKVYNNTNIKTKRSFSLDAMDIMLPSGKVDPNLLAPMPINVDDKRSIDLKKHQVKSLKTRKLVMKRRKLSPIAGTPNKDSKGKDDDDHGNFGAKTPRHKINTPKAKLEERLKKDKFGRLITPKKASLPDFRGKKTPKKTKKGDLTFEEPEKEEEIDKDTKKAMDFLSQLQAKNVLGRTLKARLAAKNPPPLTRQPSKQSIESFYQDKDKEKPTLKKKSSFGSIKSITASMKTITSFKSNKSNSIEDEEAEAGDEITKLQNLKSAKSKVKGSILAKSKVLGLTSRLTSATSTRSNKEGSAPPPSRTASKTSILSRSSSKLNIEPESKDTPSKKSEVLRAPSATSIMSMTTAAITSNPLATTLTITNQLAAQGAEINERKQQEAIAAGKTMEESAPSTSAVVASNPDADRMSMSSQKTVSSQKTSASKAGSRKTSAKNSGKNSAHGSAEPRSRKNSIMGAVMAHSAIKYLRRQKSGDSIDSAKSDATQLTIGPGTGADNNDFSTPGKILEKSQKSLERVQKTVDKATNEIHQTINENLTDLRTLEKKLSKGNLLEHDANNNDVEKGLSRHSTKLDMTAGTSKSTMVGHMSATKMGKDGMSVNAISVAPDAKSGLQQQSSVDSNQTNSSTSSSMNETRKRKLCCGLSSCCGKTRSESAQMIAGKSMAQPLTMGQKCGNCCCWPFRKISNPFKRRKVDSMDAKKTSDHEKPSMWERLCCCSSCCRRCKKGDAMENMAKKKATMQRSTAMGEKKPSCWSRMNCFKCCKPCCSRMRETCCCSSCCRKKEMDSMQSEEDKPNATPSTCTRFFCFCCLCCRKKPEDNMEERKRPSMTSQKKEGCCSRMCAVLCCRKKKKFDSRRTSMLSKKQSLAPTIPPLEDTKPKLDMVLVEHASLMKGAIPVLPVCLAYFCLICNILIPGTGTILSGFFCLCIGIPRFSQHDGARGRIGSFVINWIVGISQAFTIIFCFVGWGWSIWWGSIMLTQAKRFRRIRRAERLRDMDEEMSGKSSLPGMARSKLKDPEKGII